MNKSSSIILGVLIPNIIAAGLMALTKWVSVMSGPLNDAGPVLVFSDFVIIPLMMGTVSAAFWRKQELKNWEYFVWATVNSVVALSFSWIFMGEGYICLLIVFPLLWGMVVGGTFLGKLLFKKRNKFINSGVFGVLLVVLSVDNFLTHNYTNMVSDKIVINAPPSEVWKYVVAYDYNHEKDDYWLFQIGMPSPVQSTVDKWEKGGNRKCIFSNGYVFDEKMIVFKPDSELTFDITHQPRDPEIMGHIDITRGQFILHDNHNGTTTLIGNPWYKLYVFPAAYFDLWAESITRNVHLRVMKYIKNLSEKNV